MIYQTERQKSGAFRRLLSDIKPLIMALISECYTTAHHIGNREI